LGHWFDYLENVHTPWCGDWYAKKKEMERQERKKEGREKKMTKREKVSEKEK